MPESQERLVRSEREGAKSLTTRLMLIEVAAQMFAERGYVETSMRDIARRASLTTGALYGHFRNKAELLAEAISTRISEEFEHDRPETLDDRSMRASLKTFVINFQRRRELRALLLQGAAAAQTDEETRMRLRDEQQSHLDRWFRDYEVDRDLLGIDRTVDIEALSLFTWSAEIGLGLLEVLGIAPSPAGWADMYDRLFRGLTLPPDD
jgi:AcrR family transcriptional regulator